MCVLKPKLDPEIRNPRPDENNIKNENQRIKCRPWSIIAFRPTHYNIKSMLNVGVKCWVNNKKLPENRYIKNIYFKLHLLKPIPLNLYQIFYDYFRILVFSPLRVLALLEPHERTQ